MINTIIKFDQSGLIKQITCKGHANTISDSHSNLVCAAVTIILTGGCNALDKIAPQSTNIICQSGYCDIKRLTTDKSVLIILKTIYWQLMTLQEQYTQHFTWKEINNEI